MSIKKYIIYCEIYNHKQYTDGSEKFVELKTAPIPKEIPYIDPITKKMIRPSPKEQPKKIKCPGCGRAVTPKIVRNNDEKNRSDGSKTSVEGQQIQGKPAG